MDETDAADAASDGTLCAGVVTVSSTRTLENDEAGDAVTAALEGDENEITVREHVGADHDTVQSIVSRLIDRDDVEVVLTAGATGVEPTDVTIEAVEPLVDKKLATFSDLFTTLAFEQIGTEAITARTFAGIAEETVVFCLPGDAGAVRLALEEIVLPEAPAIVERAREDESDADGDDERGGSTADAADGGA